MSVPKYMQIPLTPSGKWKPRKVEAEESGKSKESVSSERGCKDALYRALQRTDLFGSRDLSRKRRPNVRVGFSLHFTIQPSSVDFILVYHMYIYILL